MNVSKIYAVDFDGTLCENKWPEIGEPIQEMIDYCKRLKEQGHKLILWTCRTEEQTEAAVKWCAEHGLEFDAVNENLPDEIVKYNNDPRKVGADYFIDDKNLFIPGFSSKPIEVFKNQEQLNQSLKEWQNRLFLNDWIIKAYICEPHDFKEINVCGENEFDMTNKCCVIRILDPKYYGERIMKYCAEKILVHELLHCKYNWIDNNDTYEGTYLDVSEHGLLEQMAKSLIMAKYGIGLDYFVG